jgi:hypothetical protein
MMKRKQQKPEFKARVSVPPIVDFRGPSICRLLAESVEKLLLNLDL